MATQPVKSEVPNTASPHNAGDVGSRGIKREANFASTSNKGQSESKKIKP